MTATNQPTGSTVVDAVSPMGHAHRLVRFVSVGVVGFVVSTAILAVLVGHLPNLLASLLATEVAILGNYTLHEFFTFKTGRVAVRRAMVYNASAAVGLVITAVAFDQISRQVPEWPLVVRNLAAVASGTLSNFLLSSRFVWGLWGRRDAPGQA